MVLVIGAIVAGRQALRQVKVRPGALLGGCSSRGGQRSWLQRRRCCSGTVWHQLVPQNYDKSSRSNSTQQAAPPHPAVAPVVPWQQPLKTNKPAALHLAPLPCSPP